jgi:hypothetical protein
MKKLLMFMLILGVVFSGQAFAQNAKSKDNDTPNKTQNDKPVKDDKGKGDNNINDNNKSKDPARVQENMSVKDPFDRTGGYVPPEVSKKDARKLARIKTAREKLETKKKNNQIPDAVYLRKKKALDDRKKSLTD